MLESREEHEDGKAHADEAAVSAGEIVSLRE